MTSPLRPGDPTRVGDYDLTARIGEGGQGTVYLSYAPKHGQVAVKVMNSGWASDKRALSRFAKEVAASRRVAAFCTAAVLDMDLDAELPYVVSEYIDGPSLREAVLADGPRTGSALDRLAIATATALVAIHQAGVVHRDFKPANVLLGADGPRVIDFGIARSTDATLTQTGGILGTPAYMAPEQIQGDQAEAPIDVFAWAGVMAFAATGASPFKADTLTAVINRVLHEPPRLDGVPETLEPLLAACLDKDAAKRPTAVQVLGMLVGHDPVAVRELPVTMVLENGYTAATREQTRIAPTASLVALAAPAAAGPAGAAAAVGEGAQGAAPADGATRADPEPSGTVVEPEPSPTVVEPEPSGTVVDPDTGPAAGPTAEAPPAAGVPPGGTSPHGWAVPPELTGPQGGTPPGGGVPQGGSALRGGTAPPGAPVPYGAIPPGAIPPVAPPGVPGGGPAHGGTNAPGGAAPPGGGSGGTPPHGGTPPNGGTSPHGWAVPPELSGPQTAADPPGGAPPPAVPAAGSDNAAQPPRKRGTRRRTMEWAMAAVLVLLLGGVVLWIARGGVLGAPPETADPAGVVSDSPSASPSGDAGYTPPPSGGEPATEQPETHDPEWTPEPSQVPGSGGGHTVDPTDEGHWSPTPTAPPHPVPSPS